VIYDTLYPMNTAPWSKEWESRGAWYEGMQPACYELPANWYGYHYYGLD
jgi:hypothetical protein